MNEDKFQCVPYYPVLTLTYNTSWNVERTDGEANGSPLVSLLASEVTMRRRIWRLQQWVRIFYIEIRMKS